MIQSLEVLMNKMAKETVEQQVSIPVNNPRHIWSTSSLIYLFQEPESPSSLGSLPTNSVITTGPNYTQIYLTFNNSKGITLARLNMTSNLTLSLASTKCEVC